MQEANNFIPIIIQARMSSTRLPGKVLMKIEGKPMLLYLIERLSMANLLKNAILATSLESGDDLLYDFCKCAGVICERGALDDVAGRFANILRKYDFPFFVRICGDSPLFDYRIIIQGFNIFEEYRPDLVTNTYPRSFPKGQSVEIFNTQSFLNAYSYFDGDEKEHISKHYYNHPEKFKIMNFSAGGDYSRRNLCVDSVEDAGMISKIIGAMDNEHWKYTWLELLMIQDKISAKSASL